jgi:hypothetical protein
MLRHLARGTIALVLTLSAIAPWSAAIAQPAATDGIRDDRAFSFYDRGPYKPNVPRPETLLGYDIGAMNTQYAAQERTLLAIAEAAPDRVRVQEFGTSYERRTMRLFIVSAPENLQRLDAIRADLDRLADPRTVPPAELTAIAGRVPAVVWINESVHGNESPGFETAMQTLYQLAASEEPATVEALRNAIVILNPSTNPDGHERFTVWYNSITVAHPNPGAAEHREPWSIQGRFNHYRFDLNRDVMTTTQREAQALVRAMLQWHPMVAVDQHGQTTNYFFPPAARPLNEHLGADAGKWLTIFGRGNAEAFDRYGWMYYVRDVFDLYGPFYWDTWPGLTGATGMTYETDGGGWKGIRWRREDGTILTFRDGIAKHYVSALATIETAARNRAERVRDYLAFRQSAVTEGRTGRMKRVVLVPGQDPGRAAELAATLVRSGIEVRRAGAAFSSPRAHAYADDAVAQRRFDAGAYVIDLAQPQGRMAKAFLEPVTRLDSVFAREQLDRYRRNLLRASAAEGYEFYDVTAWSLPVAFGVEAYWTEDATPVGGEILTLPDEEPALPQAQREAGRMGAPAAGSDIPAGVVRGGPARSAYLFTSARNGAPRLAYHLMRAGVRLAIATQPIEAGGEQWPRGTYIVRVGRNDSTLHRRIDSLARASGVDVTGVESAFTHEGQFGIGSEIVAALELPKVGILGDEGVSQTAYGALWWTFERRYGIDFLPLTHGYLSGGDLSELNVIIVPDASPGALSSRLGKAGTDRLRDWVRGGGTLITMGDASAWAAREDVNLTSSRVVGAGEAKDTTGIGTAADTARRPAAVDPLIPARSPSANNASPVFLPGTHFDVALDRTHWLTFGYEQPRLTVLMAGSTFLTLSKDGTNVGVFPQTGTLHRSGWVWPDNTERLLRGTAFLVEEALGRGHVVLFVNEPFFRGWWRALDRLVMNAVVLGPAG